MVQIIIQNNDTSHQEAPMKHMPVTAKYGERIRRAASTCAPTSTECALA